MQEKILSLLIIILYHVFLPIYSLMFLSLSQPPLSPISPLSCFSLPFSLCSPHASLFLLCPLSNPLFSISLSSPSISNFSHTHTLSLPFLSLMSLSFFTIACVYPSSLSHISPTYLYHVSLYLSLLFPPFFYKLQHIIICLVHEPSNTVEWFFFLQCFVQCIFFCE